MPSRMIVQGDAVRFSLGYSLLPNPNQIHIWYKRLGLDFRRGQISRRHSGKVVVLFADGHVASETKQQLEYPSLENWTRWNYDNKKHWRQLPDPETWGEYSLGWDELLK